MDPYSRVREKDTGYRNEMLPKTFGFSYRDHVTNDEVRNSIRDAIRPSEDLLTTVRKGKLRWYGHNYNRINRTCKDDPTGHGTRNGGQDKRDGKTVIITEWTILKLGEVLRKVESREGWGKVVARSSLVPKRSSRLRDSCGEDVRMPIDHCFTPAIWSP